MWLKVGDVRSLEYMSQMFLIFNYKASYIYLEKSMYKGYKAFGMCIGSLSKHVIEILLIHLKQYFLSLNFFAGCHWISLGHLR